jgi:Uncharacterized protein conserved in bacteria (DUF2330)
MERACAGWVLVFSLTGAVGVVLLDRPKAYPACCYFSAKGKDIEQPAQKVFLTWDPVKKVESFTVQPQFKGNALDFGMVIPTPSQPKLHEMPRDFFKELAVFGILKQRQTAQSNLLPFAFGGGAGFPGVAGIGGAGFPGAAGIGGIGGGFAGGFGGMVAPPPRRPQIKVVEMGVVGSLDYKILEAGRADDLFDWLKANKYHYSGDEATLNFYVQKKWVFTVMKIDTMQMKKKKDGKYAGEVTPTHFQFTSEKLVYPLKITQLSVKDKTEALFYVQAPVKMDLPGDLSYQYQWVPMLDAAKGCTSGGLPGKGEDWLKAVSEQKPELLKRAEALGFIFSSGQRPQPNKKGRTPTTMEWAKRLTADDINLLRGLAPYGDKVPNVDAGLALNDVRDPRTAALASQMIRARLAWCEKVRPKGFLVRDAPVRDIWQLQLLLGHLQEGQFLTKFRKVFTREEMNDDLELVPARLGNAEDTSEYEEMLPTSPP